MEPGAARRIPAIGYVLTVLIELPILLAAQSLRHGGPPRVTAGFWLKGCTYPIVVLVFPELIRTQWMCVLVSETFGPLAEWAPFILAFPEPAPRSRADVLRDGLAIIGANLVSFGTGEMLHTTRNPANLA